MKPENIMIGENTVTLIDFGLCNKYVDSNGNHISDNEELPEFHGNLCFSTVRQLEFKKTSRKDDFMSLAYMLIYLLNDQEMPF